jgi:hypothetical protein
MSNGINIQKLEFYKDIYTNCLFISNVKYSWHFILNDKQHVIILLYTKLLGKRIIYLDEKQIHNSKKYTYNFAFSFPLEFYNITIMQRDYFYTLKINNVSFYTLLNDLKLQQFNILKDMCKEKKRQKKLEKLQKRKNRLLQEAVKNCYKKDDKTYQINLNDEEKKSRLNTINEEIINTSNKLENDSDDSKTIHDSEIHNKAFLNFDKSFNNLNNINNDNILKNKDNKNKNNLDDKKKRSIRNKKYNNKSKKNIFKFNEKRQHKSYENINSSLNEMIDIDLLRNDNINSGDRSNTNISRNNIFSSNNFSFFDKGSKTTQST